MVSASLLNMLLIGVWYSGCMALFSGARAIVVRDVLLYVVCVTGAVVLAVEVMAVRILAPYFGNTIFAFSSVLSVVLCALALGYRYGGALADKRPHSDVFYFFVWLAGVTVIGAHLLSMLLLPFFGTFLPVTYGPLVASLALFFVPACLFGFLSPFVIALRTVTLPGRGVGTVSGEVFFWSTLGSIAGSLTSGFLLVPYVGIHHSMLVLGALVAGIGVWGTVRMGTFGARMMRVVLPVCLIACALMLYPQIRDAHGDGANTLYAADGYYEQVRVVEQEFYGKRARLLLLDRSYSSGVAWPSGALLFPYTKYIDLFGVFAPQPKQALVLGAGTGTVARALHARYPQTQVDMVDVEPKLFMLAHTYFALPDTEKIRAHTADGRQFLRTAQEGKYDIVFGDMYSGYYSVPWHVTTREFYTLLYSRMAPGGVYVGNYVLALDTAAPSLFGSTLRTLREVFDEVQVFAVNGIREKGLQNVIMLAFRTDAHVPTLDAEARIRSVFGASSYTAHLYPYLDRDLKEHRILTDDKATSDVLLAQQFMQEV